MKKKLTAILLAAAMAVTGLFTAMTPEKANAAEWEACDIPVIQRLYPNLMQSLPCIQRQLR